MVTRVQRGQTHRLVEVVKVVAHRNGRRRKDHALHLGQPVLGQVGADVDLLGHQLLGRKAALGPRELGIVDVIGVGAVADQLDAGQKLVQRAARVAQVARHLRGHLGQGLAGLLHVARDLVQRVRRGLARAHDLAPLVALAKPRVDPQRKVVVAAVAFSQRHQLVDGHKQVGHAHRCRGCLGRDLGEKTGHQRRVFQAQRPNQQAVQRAGLGPSQHLKGRASLTRADLHGPLATGLGLKAVSLVDHPVAHGRQDAPLGRHVAQQQRMIGHHHVGRGGAAARPVQQALAREVRAAVLQTVARANRQHLTRHVAPANSQRIQVAVGRLAGIRIAHGQRREHVAAHRVLTAAVDLGLFDRQVGLHGAIHPQEAGVVVVTLQGMEGHTARQGRSQCRQLVGHQLVGERVGLGRHAHRHVVALRIQDLGQQVGNRLAHARARLDRAMRRCVERRRNLSRHRHLLGALLGLLVHARHRATRSKRLVNGIKVNVKQPLALLGRVLFGAAHVLAQQLGTRRLKVEVLARIAQRQLRENRPKRPVHLGVHVGQVAHKARRHLRQRAQDHAPHTAQRVHVVAGTVRDRGTAKRARHVL